MGIEGGSIGSVGISAGIALAPSIGVGVMEGVASVSSGLAFSDFGPVMGISDLGSIVNEGPVGLIGLENTMPYILDTGNINTFSLAEQIIAEPQAASVVEQAEIIAVGVWEGGADLVSEVPDVFQTAFADINLDPDVNNTVLKQPEPQILDILWNNQITEQAIVVPQTEPMIVPGVVLDPAIGIKPNPILEEQALPSVSSQPENRTSVHQATFEVLEQSAPQQQEVEEEVLEVVKIENKEKELEEEELEINKFVEDEQASSVRKHEIREAVSKAKQEASRLGLKGIAGWLVAKFLPAEHSGNRSQIIKENGPDGSYTETIEAISGVGQLDPDIAVKRFDLIVEEKKPVKLSKEGKVVGQIDLSRVFKYKIVKPAAATYEIVTKRIKKKVPVPAGQVVQPQTEARVETSLEDYPDLAEVFKH